jgi:zinc protease
MNLIRSRAPLPIEKSDFRIPEISTFKLKNGLNICFIPKLDLPVIRLSLIVNSGSRFDPVDQKGLSNLLSMCIDEGAGNRNALQVADEFDLKGASFSVHSNNDIITFSLLVLNEFFEETLKILSDIILNPHFNEQDFEREKRKLSTRIVQLKDDPEYLAISSFDYLLYGKDNPYAYPILGNPDALKKIGTAEVKQMYSDFFSPLNSSVMVAGNIDIENLESLLEKYFGHWLKPFNQLNHTARTKFNGKQLFVVDKKDSVQTEIRTGHVSSKRNQEDYFKKLLLNNALGGQFSSRLNLNLREKHGYTYGVSSAFHYYLEDAFFNVSTSVGIENTFDALNQINIELKKITEGITSDELEFAKSSIVKSFPSKFETYSQLVSNLINKKVFNLPDDYFKTYVENVNNVSLEEINNAAKLFIQPQNLLAVLVGDRKILEEQLEKNKVEVTAFLNYNELFE